MVQKNNELVHCFFLTVHKMMMIHSNKPPLTKHNKMIDVITFQIKMTALIYINLICTKRTSGVFSSLHDHVYLVLISTYNEILLMFSFNYLPIVFSNAI
jgi:hypothetical protein